MKCPNCTHDIELTWGRYARARRDIPCLCPVCHKKFLMKFSWINAVLFLALSVGLIIGEFEVLQITESEWLLDLDPYGSIVLPIALALVLYVPALIITLPLNRLWEIKYGLLILVHDKNERR